MMELLAPAGGREALIAAVQNGADAVYLGTGAFNARRSADNFAGEKLREAVEYCHARGVKVHVTLNTLVRGDEMEALEQSVREIASSGADAFLVQDPGVAQTVKAMAPHAALHASTQMAVHNVQGVRFLKEKGFDRIVLAREMDFEEIAACAREGIEVEAFIHGALCVACSGQCLMSSLIGGRSGNRGMCAQPCRLPWRMGEREGYLLSTRDLMGLEMLDRYREAGVASLKIEGRLKRPEYVATVTGIYRRALDGKEPTHEDVEELRQIFSRGGFTRGYGPGVEDRSLMWHLRPDHAGVQVGESRSNGTVFAAKPLEKADTLFLEGPEGTSIPLHTDAAMGEQIRFPKAVRGMRLIRMTSEKQMRSARESMQGEHRLTDVDACLTIRPGETGLEVSDGIRSACISGALPVPASGAGSDPDRIRAQLMKTGGTPYRMRNVEIRMEPGLYLPVSEVNRLRREALEELARKRCPQAEPVLEMPPDPEEEPTALPERLRLCVRSGSVKALSEARKAGADELIFAPEDLRKLDAALELGRFRLALPAVMRAEELERLREWAIMHRDRIVGAELSNVGQLGLSWPGEITAGWQLNLMNDRARRAVGAERFIPSVELTSAQIARMGGRKELLVGGRIPLMFLRHCPRRATEQVPGKHRDCRICDSAEPLPPMRDRTGAEFPLKRIAFESGCVIRVDNSVPLMLLKRRNALPPAEAWQLIVTEEDAADLTRLYRLALDGSDPAADPAWERIIGRGYTTGHYFRGVE